MAKAPTKSASSTTKSKKPRAPAKTVAKAMTKSPAKPRKVAAKAKVDGVGETTTHARASSVSAEDRRRMIQDAAYYLAEKDGFQRGREQQYWATAEQQIDQLIQKNTVVATGNQQLDAVDATNDIH